MGSVNSKLLKIKSWLITLPKKHEIFLITIFFVLGAANLARVYVSWDGYLYLASAKALFRPEFFTNYHWIREPLYPILLRLTHIFLGSSDIGFALLNSSILGLAIYFLLIKIKLQRYKIYAIYFLIYGNTLTIGFIGSILQQVLIGANLIAIFTLGIIIYENTYKKITKQDKIYIFAIAFGTAINTFILYPVFCVIYLFAIVLQLYKRTLIKNGKFIIMSFIIFMLTVLTWQIYKNENSQLTFGIFTDKISPNTYSSSFRDPLIPKNDIFTGLLGLTSDVGENDYFKSEILTFGLGTENSVAENCGFFNTGEIKVVEYVDNYVTNSCKPTFFYKLLLYNQKISLFLYHAVVLTLLIGNLLCLRKSRGLVVLVNLTCWTFFSVYFFFGMGISRYIFPLYFLGVILIFSKNRIINTIRNYDYV